MRYSLILIFLLSASTLVFSQTKNIESVGFTVKDMNKSLAFYQKIGFVILDDIEVLGENHEQLTGLFGIRKREVTLLLGEEKVILTDYLTSGGRNIPEYTRSNDLFFQHIAIVVNDMDTAYQMLRSLNVEHVSTAPQTLPQSNPIAAGIKAFYFKDPDGHNLELIYFPKDKGQQKWQIKSKSVFLGIDHTAIGIRNTQKSISFYRDILGIAVQGESWNKGLEQAHLNFVENASLHITGLRVNKSLGVEFLEYLYPGPGNEFPSDSKVDDLWHWQINIEVDHLVQVLDTIVKAGYKVLSKEITVIKDKTGTYNAVIVRDPDGHAICLKEYL